MSLLEQDTSRKGRVDEVVRQMEFDAGDNDGGEYEVEAIRGSAVYARESESGHLPGLYYLVSWKGYPEEENTWEPASAVQHLRKLLSKFHHENPDKPTATVGTSWKCSELDGNASIQQMETHGISWNLGEYSVSVT